MSPKQLIAGLEKLHPDFMDQDLVIMSKSKNGEYTYELLAGVGMLIAGETSVAVLTTEASVKSTLKEGKVFDAKTNKPITEEDLKNRTNDEN